MSLSLQLIEVLNQEIESVLYLAESNRLNVFCNSVKVLKRIRRNEERRAKQ